MKKYFCDVCGAQVGEQLPMVSGHGPTADLCGLSELCPRCEDLVQSLDAAGLVMDALRRVARTGKREPRDAAPLRKSVPPPVPESPPAPVAALRGPAAKEKRAVLDALEAARRELGPGAVSAVAKRSGVDEQVIRDILARNKVPMASWRAVGKALEGLVNVPESDTGEGG